MYKHKHLRLDLQFFAEENEEPNPEDFMQDGDFDLEKFQEEFENNYQEPEEEENPEPESEEVEETPSEEEEQPSEEEPPKEEDEKPSEEKPEFQTEKQNQAFAEMRRKLEEEQKYSSFIKDLANQQGTTPEQLMEAYKQRQLEQKAEEKGVPVDVMQRLDQLENESKTSKQQAFAERFNREVEQTKSKYDLDDNAIDQTMQFMGQNGYINEDSTTKISFEDAYVLANRDKLVEQAKEQGRQEYLETKKQKQENATVNTGGGANPASQGEQTDFSDEDVFNMLDKMDIQY